MLLLIVAPISHICRSLWTALYRQRETCTGFAQRSCVHNAHCAKFSIFLFGCSRRVGPFRRRYTIAQSLEGNYLLCAVLGVDLYSLRSVRSPAELCFVSVLSFSQFSAARPDPTSVSQEKCRPTQFMMASKLNILCEHCVRIIITQLTSTMVSGCSLM